MLLDNPYRPDHRPRREIESLLSAGWRVHLICEAGENLPELEQSDALTVRRINPPWRRGVGPLAHSTALRTGVPFLETLLPPEVAVIHCHDMLTLPFGAKLSTQRGLKLVYDAHEFFPGQPLPAGSGLRARFRRFIRLHRERQEMQRADRIITVSEEIAGWMRAKGGPTRPPLVIKNRPDWRVPFTENQQIRTRFGIPEEALLMIHAGNIRMHTRRLDMVVKGLGLLPMAHLVCIGDGEFAALRRLACEVGVAYRLHHLPAVPYEQLGPILAGADLGLSVLDPGVRNHHGALPNKLFEYLAAGLPVVTSPVQSQTRFIRDEGVGLAMDSLDPEDFARVIQNVKGQLTSLRATVAARTSHYAWAPEGARLVAAYEEFRRA